MASVTKSLICWLQTFPIEAPHRNVKELTDGVALAQVLSQIAPDHFHSVWLTKFKTGAENNWRLKVSNLKKILEGVIDYYSEVLEQQITGFTMPDINAIAEHNDALELGKLIQLVLGCAINCSRKQEYIEVIMRLEEDVQHVVMNAIQELITSASSGYSAEGFAELGEQLKRVVEDLQAANEAKKQISHRCHELDMQVAVLQEEKNNFLLENERLHEKLNHIESLEDPSTVAGKRFQHMQYRIDMLQDEVYKLETARDEYRLKSDFQEKEILDLQQKNDELQKLAEEARSMKDELDVLRHLSDKVEFYETTIESYKKKLEDMSDLKRQIKMLEDKNAGHVQHNMELEEDLKKSNMLKIQLDMYKKQVQELHANVSSQTKRADKAEFENKRVAEKHSSLQREKERLVSERDFLKETIEDLKCTQLQNVTVGLNDESKRASGSFDSDMLEVTPEIKEKMIRLMHENKMLKLRQNSNDDQQLALLQSMLDDSKARQNELETENRLASQRIIELEGQIEDLHESRSAAYNQEGEELRQIITSVKRKQRETDSELQKKVAAVEVLQSQLQIAEQKAHGLQEHLNKKDEDMRAMEERYKKYLEKAKNVIKTLDPKQGLPAGPDVISLKNQLQEKEKIIANLEREAEKSKAMMEMEGRLIYSAFYNMGAQLQRKSVEDRMRLPSGTPQSFLSRQRQATTRRMNLPGVATSEFFE